MSYEYGMFFIDDLVHFQQLQMNNVVVSYCFLLSVLDKMEAYFSVYIYSVLAVSSSVFRGMGFKQLNLTFYALLEAIYLRHANETANLFKILEPLCVGCILEWRSEDAES